MLLNNTFKIHNTVNINLDRYIPTEKKKKKNWNRITIHPRLWISENFSMFKHVNAK